MQLYDRGGKVDQEAARAQLIDIVREAGDNGFETLVRSLAKNDQEDLANQLDAELAEPYIKRPLPEAGTLSFLVIFASVDRAGLKPGLAVFGKNVGDLE